MFIVKCLVLSVYSDMLTGKFHIAVKSFRMQCLLSSFNSAMRSDYSAVQWLAFSVYSVWPICF